MVIWPVVKGDYTLSNRDSACAVAIIGNGQVNIPADLFAIMGRFKTENLGIEKIVLNIISNPRIRFLIVCGKEEFGHFPGDAILCLYRNGVDEQKRIIGTRAAIPYLCNIPFEAIERFRRQIEVIDLISPKDAVEIIDYDPLYIFEKERAEELIKTLQACNDRDPGPFDEPPFVLKEESLDAEGNVLASAMSELADHFTGHMLRMPSEQLSTTASIAVVSAQFRIIYDPVDGLIRMVPSVELAVRLQSYLRGEG